ncbi:MAG: M20 family metallopeptidase [Oscillospiraceae bacterium]|nr:M20 family metallopeptidase [Oscillospiraceae bacterium]
MKSIHERVEALRPEIRNLAHQMHEDPELGMQEFHAVANMTALLEKYGFTIERNVCDLETAYIATYKSSKPGPVIGFLAEYDALKGMGHACGHNMIGALAVCNGIALREAIDTYGGEVRVIGAPAEETLGGKVNLAAAGRYDDLAVAMMAHPFGQHRASGGFNALDSQRFEFFGKSAHAGGAPWKGVNALNGVIETFNNINALRGHVEPDARVAGVIRDGGKVANIVPDYAMAEFYIRHPDSTYLRGFSEKVINCAKAAALATGTELKVTNFEGWYDDLHTNETLSRRAVEHTKAFGVTQDMEKYSSTGSSDIGNVSYRCPTIHQWFDVIGGNTGIGTHTPELLAGADSDYGYDQLFIVAKAFVATAEDVLTDPAFLAAIRKEFDDTTCSAT